MASTEERIVQNDDEPLPTFIAQKWLFYDKVWQVVIVFTLAFTLLGAAFSFYCDIYSHSDTSFITLYTL